MKKIDIKQLKIFLFLLIIALLLCTLSCKPVKSKDALAKIDGFNDNADKVLILVHGFEPSKVQLPEGVYFTTLIDKLKNDSYFTTNFKCYQLLYNSWDLSLLYYNRDKPTDPDNWPTYKGYTGNPTNSAQILAQEMNKYILSNPNDEIYFVAHSMGGLVIRAAMEMVLPATGEKFGEKVKSIFTLATPHHGTPLANTAWLLASFKKYEPKSIYDLTAGVLDTRLFLPNKAGYDLVWDNWDNNGPEIKDWAADDLRTKTINRLSLWISKIHFWANSEIDLMGAQMDNYGINNTDKILNNLQYANSQKYLQKIFAFYTSSDVTKSYKTDKLVKDFANFLDQAYKFINVDNWTTAVYSSFMELLNTGFNITAYLQGKIRAYDGPGDNITYVKNDFDAIPENSLNSNATYPYENNDGIVPTYSAKGEGLNLASCHLKNGTHFSLLSETPMVENVLATVKCVTQGSSFTDCMPADCD